MKAFIGSVLLVVLLGVSSVSSASVYVSVGFAPPPLLVYEQPLLPAPGYIWVPGYWAWGPDGFYWVPGTWVLAPYIGALWTPGYWGWDDGLYIWYPGYWGPRVGFYGGINYGFGYFGVGYYGGYWRNGVFSYNTALNNVNVTYIRNVYNQPVVANTTTSRVSFNGGTGGIVAQPTAAERLAQHDRHLAWTPVQARHEQAARTDRAQLASVNQGVPRITATSRAGVFREQSAAAARGGGNREARIERGPQGQSAVNAAPPRVNREARIERGPQGQSAVNAGPPRVNREARIERGPQGQSAVNAGPPRANREARIERGGPPSSAGGGYPQNTARVQNAPQPQSQPQQQGQPRGGRGGEREHHEEHQK